MKYDQGRKKEEVVVLEIPNHEFEQMLENDYRYRVANAVDGEIVERRTVQEIFDELNSEELSSWRKHNRRLIPVKAGDEETSEMDMMDLVIDVSQVEQHQRQENYEAQCQWLRERLNPDQAEMMITISLDGMRVKDYANKINDDLWRVYKRYDYAKKILKEDLKDYPHVW